MRSEIREIEASLAQLAAQGADADRLASAAVATWRNIDAALSPVVGPRGTTALFNRSLHLARNDHSWLTAAQAEGPSMGAFDALQTTLSKQPAANIAVANRDLLEAFCDLLANLVGLTLTERLLRSVWVNPSNGTTAQDVSP